MFLLPFLITLASCGPIDPHDSINQFTFNLLDNVAVDHDNFAISPLSVWNIYALLAEAASGNTFDELMLQLQLPKDLEATQALETKLYKALKVGSSDVVLKKESAIFAERDLQLHMEFCRSAATYGGEVFQVDTTNTSRLAEQINYYICVATSGKIKDAVSVETLENLKLLLVDAMYFKANWTVPFDPTQTRESPFYDHHGRNIGTVNMMFQKAPNNVALVEELEAEMLEMPYGVNKDYAMTILQPLNGNTVKKLLKTLTKTSFKQWSKVDDDDSSKIECYVPRFSVKSQIDLVQALKYMGIIDIFDDVKAQLPGISDTPLYVSKTIQRVDLDVNEAGTEVAASTVVGLENRILSQRIEINKPFVYMIKDKRTDIVLFAGVYSEPKLV